MMPDDLIEKFSSLNIWKNKGRRAPNKPLLILFALGKYYSRGTKKLSFSVCENEYEDLLREYGKADNPHPEYAFYRLKNDKDGALWSFYDPEGVVEEKKNGDALITDLRKPGVEGGFPPNILEEFNKDPALINRLAEKLLTAHFPDSLHLDILNSVGLLPETSSSVSKKRDPNFCPNVLSAYEHQCAVCDFSLRLGKKPIALDAAHIKWHSAGGLDEVNNGLALCSLHHKLFDRGAFTVLPDHRLVASEQINSTGKHTILDFHGKKIFVPQNPKREPNPEYLEWHRSEVFKEPPRHLS